MKLSAYMNGRVPDPAYVANTADTTDSFVLAINLSNKTDAADYIVANEGISEQAGSLNPETTDSQYIHTGKRTSKTGTQRQFSLNGDRFSGDEFQDVILSHKVKYGVGNTIVFDYVYFNVLTGLGESGKIDVVIDEDTSGSAGENSSFSATLSAQGTPVEYAYVPAP